jgi:hypothetical protein
VTPISIGRRLSGREGVHLHPQRCHRRLAAVSEKRQPSIGFLRATRKMPQFEQVLDMVEFIASPAALELVDKWVPTDLIEMFEQWSEWNKTAAGE